MATPLKEFTVRTEAHAYLAQVIAEKTAPHACCTEHVGRGDTVIVWDDSPEGKDFERLPKEFIA